MRSLLLSHIVAHMLINIYLLTSYVSVFIRKSILNSLSWSKSSETNPWWAVTVLPNISTFLCLKLCCFLLCFINCKHEATTEKAAIFFLIVSLSYLILFASQFLLLFFFNSSNMYLYWDHSVGTSLGKGSKRRRQQKMTEEGARKIKKSDVPHTNSSVYFLLLLNLYSFFISHKAVIILQQ